MGKDRLVAVCDSPTTADFICRLQWAAVKAENARAQAVPCKNQPNNPDQ